MVDDIVWVQDVEQAGFHQRVDGLLLPAHQDLAVVPGHQHRNAVEEQQHRLKPRAERTAVNRRPRMVESDLWKPVLPGIGGQIHEALAGSSITTPLDRASGSCAAHLWGSRPRPSVLIWASMRFAFILGGNDAERVLEPRPSNGRSACAPRNHPPINAGPQAKPWRVNSTKVRERAKGQGPRAKVKDRGRVPANRIVQFKAATRV